MEHPDIQQTLEQRSLRNVRALVDNLQKDERSRRKWILYTVIGFLPIAILAGAAILKTWPDPAAIAAADRSRQCELAWWAERSGEFERRLRNTYPDMPHKDIQKKLERAGPSMMAEAKAECDGTRVVPPGTH
jgi:hypothetical protein